VMTELIVAQLVKSMSVQRTMVAILTPPPRSEAGLGRPIS
jgi:hypothetical protein